MIKNIFAKSWIQIPIGTLWYIILYIGGLNDIEPMWMRFLLFPIQGLPYGFFYLHEVKSEGLKISIGEYAFVVFFCGPIMSMFVGHLILGAFAYVFM